MTSRCHGHQSGSHKSVRASQDTGVVRAMVLTPLPAPRSGIPSARSILATLGCKVLQGRSCDCVLHKPQTARHFFCSRICVIRSFDERCFRDSDVVCPLFFLRVANFLRIESWFPVRGLVVAIGWGWTCRPSEARTERADGIPLCGVGSGVRTIARTTPDS